jgi:hypothetical protein
MFNDTNNICPIIFQPIISMALYIVTIRMLNYISSNNQELVYYISNNEQIVYYISNYGFIISQMIYYIGNSWFIISSMIYYIGNYWFIIIPIIYFILLPIFISRQYISNIERNNIMTY